MAENGKRKLRNDHQSAKSKKRSQNFIPAYSLQWPCLKASKQGVCHAYCEVCRVDICIAHGGRDDCRRHVNSKKHTEYAKLAKVAANSNMSLFLEKTSQFKYRVMDAEVAFVDLCVENNLPFAVMDKITTICKTKFSDSEIAKSFACGRSKATAIVSKNAEHTQKCLIEVMKDSPFTLSTDGSNDTDKLFPLVIRTVDPLTSEVRSDVLSVPICKGSATGKNIFDLIDKVFKDEQIPWTNCLALGSDNANVMVGKKNGVYGHMLTVHPSIYLSGSACHLIHHAAENAARSLPFSIDQILVDVYFYIDKSSLRKSSLKAMQVLHELKDTDMLKHVCTRWLSVSRCLNRVLENWDPLLQFVTEESSSSTSKTQVDRLHRLKTFFRSPTNRLYCLFLKHAIAVFDKYNTELQCAEPKIHVLRRRLHSLLKELFVMFVKPSAMIYKDTLDVKYTLSSNIKVDNDLLIGDEARAFLSQKEENHLREKRIEEFFKNVKSFYTTACTYITQKLPLSCELLKHAEVTDMQRQTESHQSSVQFFLKKFPCLISEEERGKLEIEFALYQVTDIRDIKKKRLDEAWAEMGQMKDENGSSMFQVLPKFMLRILTIPHSSAHCERIFSMVRKTHTAFRPNMNSQTLEAILITKSRSGNAGTRHYTNKQLDSLKTSYAESLSKSEHLHVE